MTATQIMPVVRREYAPSRTGLLWRVVVALLLLVVVALLPWISDTTWNQRISLAAIYGIIGLSVNVITGHAGQVSLGHQAFVGIGAFASAFVVSNLGGDFLAAVVVASLTGAALAVVLGLAALRVRGLYLALVTLAFGLTAETTLFNWRAFTGGGAGAEAPRPAVLETEMAYAYLCLGALGLVLLLDWRLVKSKAGRAIAAVRNDERVAATLGINVTGYKLLAFVVSGFLAGLAGALFAHWNEVVQALDFDFQVALVWVLMAVVGGLGSRAGVVVASVVFALLPTVLPTWLEHIPNRPDFLNDATLHVVTPLIGALLLLLTLTLHPGGIADQLAPLRRWLAGGPLFPRRRPVAEPGEQVAGCKPPQTPVPPEEVRS
ncbi:MAG: branched-chain amino acid ABC transporter permease [Micromonosporaceae bacterium]